MPWRERVGSFPPSPGRTDGAATRRRDGILGRSWAAATSPMIPPRHPATCLGAAPRVTHLHDVFRGTLGSTRRAEALSRREAEQVREVGFGHRPAPCSGDAVVGTRREVRGTHERWDPRQILGQRYLGARDAHIIRSAFDGSDAAQRHARATRAADGRCGVCLVCSPAPSENAGVRRLERLGRPGMREVDAPVT